MTLPATPPAHRLGGPQPPPSPGPAPPPAGTGLAPAGTPHGTPATSTGRRTGLGAGGILGLIGWVGQSILFVLTLLPGTKGENGFGPDPRDPSQRYGGGFCGPTLNAVRPDGLFAPAKRPNAQSDHPYKHNFPRRQGPAQPRHSPAPPGGG